MLTGVGNNKLLAQTVSKDTAIEANSQNAETTSLEKTKGLSKNNLKPLGSGVSYKAVDFEKLENERYKVLSKQKMSGKRKVMWAAIIAGSVIGLFFLIKYAKECEVYETNCPIDDVCPCLRFRERN